MKARAVALLLLTILGLAGCTTDDGQRLDVSAAASLTEVFTELAALYEDRNDVEVALNLAGSTTLVEQLVRGAPVDVLATADERTMLRAVDEGVVDAPLPFATNQLVVAAPADGPPRDVGDLADDELLVGLCAPDVPCGTAARDALDALGVAARPDTEDPDVRSVLARLMAGELDVGVVYGTDIAASDGTVSGRPIDGATTTLVIATTPGAPPAAADFVALLRSATGAAILRAHGFGVVEVAP